ncbi:MAG: hypothetical protein EOO20_09170, partial [Chryseobacterium sp.]
MSVIQIFANGIELDYDRNTLTIRKENNAFITDFKLSRASFPFKIVENDRTVLALGTRDITSVIKKKVVPVTVLEMGTVYHGELEILSYMKGFRKCDLKYGSKILDILNSKLIDLLPVISVIPGENNPVPFTEEATGTVHGYQEWETYPLDFIGKVYPEVDFCFPRMVWKKKFGEDLAADSEWFSYADHYNNYWLDAPFFETPQFKFIRNSFKVDGQEVQVFNRNIASPQLFLLSIFKLAFASIGYSIEGEFTEDEFIKRILVLSVKSNLCTVKVGPPPVNFPFSEFTYYPYTIGSPAFPYLFDVYESGIVAESSGEYVFKYKIVEPLRSGGTSSYVLSRMYSVLNPVNGTQTRMDVYKNYNVDGSLVFEGEFTIPVSLEEVGATIGIAYRRHKDYNSVPVTFEITGVNTPRNFNMMHPTIQLGRFAPETTLASYMNDIKNLFCLDIRIDDIAKKVSFNYTKNLLKDEAKHIALKSLALTEYEPPLKIAFVLKYGSDQDTSLYISRDGIELDRESDDDYVETIETKFKLVPMAEGTADLSGDGEKSGTGLMIMDPVNMIPYYDIYDIPVVSQDYQGKVLTMDGNNGIYENYWKTAIRFRLNASKLEMEGPFTESEISAINRLQKIYIDHQAYVILSLEYRETAQDNYIVKLKME